jgi:hypothetical protein
MIFANRAAPGGFWTVGRVAPGARPLLVTLLLGLVACGGAGPASRPVATPQPGKHTSPDPNTAGEESLLPGAVVEASGTGTTEAEAYEQAQVMLEDEVYGDHPWTRALELPVHDRETDLFHQEVEDGRVRVLVGLERERLDGLLQELASQPVPAAVPMALIEALASPHGMYLEAFACERRLALLDEPCGAAPSRDDIAAELQTLAGEIRLRTRLADGIPLDSESRPLRPLEIVLERVTPRRETTELPGVPDLVVQPDGVDAVSVANVITDQAGVARFALRAGEPWPGDLRVALDVDAFLGPLAEMWPPSELTPTTRQASVQRWSVIATDRVQCNLASAPMFGAGLVRSLPAGGGEAMVALHAATSRKLTTAPPSTLPQLLPALADQLQGRLDVLIVVELDSEFASRMGAYRVWYEARGRVQVYDVWTGKRLLERQDAVTATGVGDERADQAARGQLAEKLADELSKNPPVVR